MKITKAIVAISICLYGSFSFSSGIYQEPNQFIAETFPKGNFQKKVIWLDKKLQKELAKILDHKYKGLRISYFIEGTKTAWILDEIGKEKSITTGFVVEDNKIKKVRVLIFRESRGWEVKHAFFTNQFKDAALKNGNQLDRDIDNISGATLSVRAITKLSKIALLLHRRIISPPQ